MNVYLVGGSIRDGLLGRPVADQDFVVVGATPQQMIDAGYKQVGSDFPVFLDSDGQEYALARTERKTGAGYHGFEVHYDPDVTLEQDLERRDVTINAMARDQDGSLVDPFDGYTDLQNGVIRHVSQAFAEDPVRVLRVARFVARYNFTVASETIDLMRQLTDSGELDHLVPERVWLELTKALMEDYPAKFLWVLRQCGALKVLFPELDQRILGVASCVSRSAIRHAPLNVRVMLLCKETLTHNALQMLKRLRAPNETLRLTEKFLTVLEQANQDKIFDAQSVFNLLKQIDAFRQPDDLFAVVDAFNHVRNSSVDRQLDKVLHGYAAAKDVCFATLSDQQKQQLRGPQIGQAIDDQRLQRVRDAL